jgi:predicted HD phosphohydrolase
MPPQHTAAMNCTDILSLWARRGHLIRPSEGVTQLQHAWQCARLARRAHAPPALELAAWLHDLGHLLAGPEGCPMPQGIDDDHQDAAARLLEPLFGAAVSKPVQLHVAAKRHLVATQPGYQRALSAPSLHRLALQGGPMSTDESRRFVAQAHARDALRLRMWDDQAKVAGLRPVAEVAVLDELEVLMAGVRCLYTASLAERLSG